MKPTMKLKLYSLVIFLMFIPASVYAASVPDTGQTKCYNDSEEIPCPSEGQDFYGQDGNYSINPMSYTKLDATGNDLPITATDWAMVRDNVTGLIWENNSHESTWDNASTVIAELNSANFGGYSDWRLPTMTELGSIVDFSIPDYEPTININYFKDTFASFYWSSTTHVRNIYYVWGVYFHVTHDGRGGDDDARYKYETYSVRAVRGGQSVIGEFDTLTINGNGTVSDSETGLMWQQDTAKTESGGTTMVWKDALSYCENLDLGGYTDWRLPTVKELRSIVDYTVYEPAIDINYFKDTFAPFYWSSTPYSNGTPNAWGVYFDYGYDYGYHGKNYSGYVRAVRGGQPVIEPDPSDNLIISASISPTTATLTQPGEEIHFLVKGYLSSGEITTPKNIKWETSDSDVVSTENGKIIAVGEGTATITASVGNLTAQAEVTVSFTPVAIEVSPVLLFLEKGKSAEPVVSVLYSDGRRKTLTDLSEYSLTATTDSDNVQINGKKITAIADGISDIEVKAKFGSSELSASLRVNVTAPVPLNITPAAIRVKQSESVVIEIDGGTPPYSVSLVSPSSSSDNAGTVEQVSGQYIWTVTAPSKGGEYSYSISDSTGQKAVLTMTVLASLTIEYQTQKSGKTLDSVSQSYSGSQRANLKEFALKATGGTPPFKWFSTSGEITATPSDTSQITYIPPSSAGIYTVTVVDSGGQSQDFKVSTIVQLNTIPEKIYLAQNESSDISIFGGVSPFTVSADAGVAGKISYYPGVGVFSYTAPATSGDYMLTVKDSAGNTVRVYANVSPKLTVSPSKAYLRRNQTQTFQIAGGVGSDDDIYITTLQGEADSHPENMKFNYKTLGATGSDVITITDLSGAQAKVEIEIINSDTTGDFFITPSNVTLLKKESRLFKSVGGIGQEIVWKSEHGTISGQKQQSIEYTAPDIKPTTPDTADTKPNNHLNTHLYAADLNTREASTGIYVIADKVVISPSQVFLKPGEHADFQGHFGTEEYKFTWTKGDGSVDETSGILTYTAPSEVGTYYITVFDSSGSSSKAEVVVRGGAKRTKIKKTDIFEIANPSPTPNSETQPAAVGSVQKGEKSFSLAFDFPNYKDGKGDVAGEPVPMNFYAAAFIPDMNLWVLFDEHGNLFDLNNITACMSNMTNAVYTESLKFDYCNPDSPLKVDMYVLAVESKYDINNNLSFQPADAPFELWHYSFSFPKCK